jgi:hypothetical protein
MQLSSPAAPFGKLTTELPRYKYRVEFTAAIVSFITDTSQLRVRASPSELISLRFSGASSFATLFARHCRVSYTDVGRTFGHSDNRIQTTETKAAGGSMWAEIGATG